MGYRLAIFSDIGLTEPILREAIDEHLRLAVPRLSRFWDYFRNGPLAPHAPGKRARLAQEEGLPSRLTGRLEPWQDDRAITRREVVIENDIAWRIQAMVDFAVGRPPALRSLAADPALAGEIERALARILERSGGAALLQEAALLAHIYGHVDLLVRAEGPAPDDAIRTTAIEPTRALAFLDPADYRRILAHIVHFQRRIPGPSGSRTAWHTEILSARARQVYIDEILVEEHAGPTGPRAESTPPIVHIQNLHQPFRYEGLGEVEPLIPLQDELNTRLSDRASRITLQSFKMYLAKGIEGFDRFPVAPGQVWRTDNPQAEITSFGGDAASPREDAHIEQIREALDKASGIPPLAGGVVRARIGNLSSANALRVTLLSALSRTARKRAAYARALARIAELALAMLDDAGALRTAPADRAIAVVWPDPLPEDIQTRLAGVSAKAGLGANSTDLLDELGHTAGAAELA